MGKKKNFGSVEESISDSARKYRDGEENEMDGVVNSHLKIVPRDENRSGTAAKKNESVVEQFFESLKKIRDDNS
jgi:hypothetical protein